MKIYDIDNISKGTDGLYDLTQLTFQFKLDNQLRQYIVQRGEEMRIDLVCQSIYDNMDNIDLICSINNIDNPLNIREGQIIIYPSGNFDSYRFSERDKQNTIDEENIKQLSNVNKNNRKDQSRKDYLDNNSTLPPTILKKRTNQFNVEGDKIILGRGLF